MTRQRAKYKRRTGALPSGLGLDILVTWTNEGPWNIAPTPLDRSRYNARARAIRALRRLATGLEVPPDECTELARMRGRDFGDLSDALLNALARRARTQGYLMPGGRARTPLTPVQSDTLYRTVWGASCEDIALDTGTTATGASGNLKRMREQHQCSTTGHLVATAYRNHWLPDNEELRTLLRGRMVWQQHGVPRLSPPYRWKGES